MKIRCTDCSKKISIDDAFAGGVCRCPYCSTLVFVPEEGAEAAAATGPRPTAPGARPETPAEMEAVAKARGQEQIPVASPVRLQGIVTMILLGLLFAMFIGGVALYLAFRPKGIEPPPPPSGDAINPFLMTLNGPSVAGNIPLQPPVVYVVDFGGGMTDLFDPAQVMVQTSARTLGDGQFTILLAREKEAESLGAMRSGKDFVDKAIEDMFQKPPEGSSDIPLAFKAAIGLKPRTIVLVTAKAIETLDNLIALAKENAVMVDVIFIGQEDETAQKLAQETGGQCRGYHRQVLNAHVEEYSRKHRGQK